MAQNESQQTVCRSVFKSGESTTSQKQFTEKWIELINRLEKKKDIRRKVIMTSRFPHGIMNLWEMACSIS